MASRMLSVVYPLPATAFVNFSNQPASLAAEGILSSTDDKSLVDRCRKGEDEAWRERVDLFGQKVYSVAYHFTLKREDAEELAQEIFLKIFENLHRYAGSFPSARGASPV